MITDMFKSAKRFYIIKLITASPSGGSVTQQQQQKSSRKYRFERFLASFSSVNPLVEEEEEEGGTKRAES